VSVLVFSHLFLVGFALEAFSCFAVETHWDLACFHFFVDLILVEFPEEVEISQCLIIQRLLLFSQGGAILVNFGFIFDIFELASNCIAVQLYWDSRQDELLVGFERSDMFF